ncbi:MAG: RteC domain-containing protein [Saprospiraceae bacterium]|nr:RteC domain-containing protein [Saprospiraceae bacterium]
MLRKRLLLVMSKFKKYKEEIDNGLNIKALDLKSYLQYHIKLTEELLEVERTYTFKDQAEEIRYYKIEKPEFMKYGIFIHRVREMHLEEPFGFSDTKIEFLQQEMNKLRKFQEENKEMYRYFKANETDKDAEYFYRNSDKMDIFAPISASYMLEKYLYSEKDPRPLSEKLKDFPSLKWGGSNVELIELIYVLAYAGKIEHESKEMDMLVKAFEGTFDIDLGNHYRTFLDIRNRQEPAKLLLVLVDTLRVVVDILNENLDNRKNKLQSLDKIKEALAQLRLS